MGSSPTRRISSKVGYLAAATASKELKLDTVIKIAAGTPARECADVQQVFSVFFNEKKRLRSKLSREGVRKMPPDRKEAAEKLRQLVNSNLKNEIEVSVSYDICLSKTDTSLLTVNK